MTHAANNPFFGKFKTPFETPPFDKIKIEHYEPAFDEGIKQMEKEVQEIANNPQPATFENTVVALERSGKLLETVSSVFSLSAFLVSLRLISTALFRINALPNMICL